MPADASGPGKPFNRWSLACRHFAPSLSGWLRLFSGDPSWALRLLLARTRYFLFRVSDPALTAPGGFTFPTPDALIAYWAIVVERELEHADWKRALLADPSPVVVDVGANAGVFSHYIHSLRPGVAITAFEPLPRMAARLRTLPEMTGMKLRCIEAAVSDREGEACMETPSGSEGTSRLAAGSAVPDAGGLRVKMVTLDAALDLPRITLMKIDVEGFEPDVIRGARGILQRTDHLIVEAHTLAHRDRIREALGAGWRETALGPSDYLFSRESGPGRDSSTR